jgi:hypothetical protein|tara:strand:- start:3448 stop:3687 length:240 start_codon:yes stop_codon:yes gene_type:complete
METKNESIDNKNGFFDRVWSQVLKNHSIKIWNDTGEIPMYIYKTKNMENKYVHWSVTLKELNSFEMDVIYNLVRGFRKC